MRYFQARCQHCIDARRREDRESLLTTAGAIAVLLVMFFMASVVPS